MKIKEILKQDAGFQYVVDNMELMSAAGRRAMLDTAFSTDAAWLEAEWNRTEKAIDAVKEYKYKKQYIDLRHCLMCLHDLHGTLASLAAHTPLNEVELFEVKNLAQLTRTAKGAIEGLGLAEMLPLPCTDEVFDLLDPDRTGIANFYVYDSYDPRLAPLRRELSALQTAGGDPARISELLALQNDIQAEVCLRLSDELTQWCDTLNDALNQLAYADVLLAKAELAIDWNLTRPSIGGQTAYEALVNPRLKQRNESMGMRYQPVDITLGHGVCLITGANMAGKTVLLKSVATAQTMAQCGMFVPAAKATLMLVDGVSASIGDDQDEMNGLSSYASEITKISSIVADAIVEMLEGLPSVTLVTTHYSGLGNSCRRLRVKGFVEGMSDLPLNPQNINRFIDYSLQEDTSDEVPHEALRIAAILGCDAALLDAARRHLGR